MTRVCVCVCVTDMSWQRCFLDVQKILTVRERIGTVSTSRGTAYGARGRRCWPSWHCICMRWTIKEIRRLVTPVSIKVGFSKLEDPEVAGWELALPHPAPGVCLSDLVVD